MVTSNKQVKSLLEFVTSVAADSHQLIACVPGVSIHSVASRVAVGFVQEGRAFPLRDLIVRVARRLAHCDWQPGPRKSSTRTVSPPGVVVS